MNELVPSQKDTDLLVAFYLSHLEELHRIVHIPTFRKAYAEYWRLGILRDPAMTATILSMISISVGAVAGICEFEVLQNTYRGMPAPWIFECDEWLRQQSSKHNMLVRYQVSCLVYLAKRMNLIRKKRFWIETGSLMQNAIMDGLHLEPSPTSEGLYVRVMKQRIWATIREMELQNCFEYGLPTLLHNIECDVAAPTNVDDGDFDESSKTLPASKPSSAYTCMSYQHHSARSWALRLDLSRFLFSPGFSKTEVNYKDVLRYTHELTQELHSIPPWDKIEIDGRNGSKCPILAFVFLKLQLIECLLAIHRPYIQKSDNKYWLSENICYQMSRDILHFNSKLADQGIQSLSFLREDLLLASLHLTRLSMLQPRGLYNFLTFPKCRRLASSHHSAV
jgi:hypothetical protein